MSDLLKRANDLNRRLAGATSAKVLTQARQGLSKAYDALEKAAGLLKDEDPSRAKQLDAMSLRVLKEHNKLSRWV